MARRHLSSQQKAVVAVEAKELSRLLAEQAKQAQIKSGRLDGKNPDGTPKVQVTQKIVEPEDNIDPETAATIAVEMGEDQKKSQLSKLKQNAETTVTQKIVEREEIASPKTIKNRLVKKFTNRSMLGPKILRHSTPKVQVTQFFE